MRVLCEWLGGGAQVHVLDAAEAKGTGFIHVSAKLKGQIVGLDFFRYAATKVQNVLLKTYFTYSGRGLLASLTLINWLVL